MTRGPTVTRSMSIHVEFFGVARQRAGVAAVDIPAGGPLRLATVLALLSERFPALADECFERGRLRRGYICNVDGNRFVNASETSLDAGSTLLIMPADAGG